MAGRATAQEVERDRTPAAPSQVVRDAAPRDVRERPMAAGEATERVSLDGDRADEAAPARTPPPAGVAIGAQTNGTAGASAQAGDTSTVRVMVDHAKVVRLPDRTQTVIVGNPMVADITIQRNGIIVVTGKSYGATNLIALDSAGLLLAESTISVQAPTDAIVTVQRGLARESYSCTPTCQPSLRLGDSQEYFGAVGNQTTQRNTLATQR